jgi:hypothetical protein
MAGVFLYRPDFDEVQAANNSRLLWLAGSYEEILAAGYLYCRGFGFNLFPLVNRLTAAGWLPGKAEGAYRHLLTHQSSLDNLFLHGRAGTLRPIVALVVLAAAYLFYQQHKDWLLRKTGALINQFGRETLWVYTGQAVLLPWMAVLPFRYGNLAVDLAMTSLFFYSMWLVARRKLVAAQARAYISTLRFSYNQAKYGYLQKFSE